MTDRRKELDLINTKIFKIFAIAFCAFVISNISADAQNLYWMPASGTSSWFTVANWNTAYTGAGANQLPTATNYDDVFTKEESVVYDAISYDAALNWQPVSETYQAPVTSNEDTFLDEDLNVLVKTGTKWLKDAIPEDGCHITNKDKTMAVSSVSVDEGKSWSKEENIGLNMIPFRIIKLSDNTLLMPCGRNDFLKNGRLHQSCHFFKGTWQDSGEITWEPAGSLNISPDKSSGGLSEPHIAELPDGRIVVLLRMGAILPSEESQGAASVKLISVSSDRGVTWSELEPLKWDNGTLLYSPRSYQDIFCSHKNGKLYAILNICDEPTFGCDPRSSLQMVEIDQISLCAKRNSVTLIDEKHSEAHPLIRFSNWVIFEDRTTLNPIILMRMHMSEFCPVRHGYDLSSYRYEIII